MPGIVDAVEAKIKEVGIKSYDDGTQGNEEQTITIDENLKPELQDLNAYYDCERKNFLITNSRGDWIPEELRDDRFGVKSFQHPEILEAMGEQSPEYRLNEYITEVFFGINQPYQDDWTGKTIEIERKLRDSGYSKEVDRMFYWPAACGTYLGKLAKNGETGKRYKKLAKRDGYTQWKIYRNPAEEVDQTTEPF